MSDSEKENNEKPFPKDSQIKEEEVEENNNNINHDEDNNFPEEQNNESGKEQENNNGDMGDDFDKYINNINHTDEENNNKDEEDDNEENNNNKNEEENNEINNQDNTFPEKEENNDDDFVDVENNKENDNNNHINNKQEEKLDDTNNDNNNKENSFRFSDEHNFQGDSHGGLNVSNKENEFEYENENKNENENNNNNNNNSFGFRDSDVKNTNNNNENNNQYDNFRLSGNSDNMNMNNNNQIKEDESPNKFNMSLKKDNNNDNNNNFVKKSNNNSFNYAKNPYNSTNNNNNNTYNIPNPNGGFGYSNNNNNNNNKNQNQDANLTGVAFVPQDSPITNKLNNYNYSSNYNPPKLAHHSEDYDSFYEAYEQYPEDNDGFHIDPSKRGKDSSTTAGVQIANTIMGAGILSIPIVMSYLGFFIGSILVLFMAISTVYTVYILIRCHQITGKSGYSMFGKITMGKAGSILVKVMIIINNLGMCICYLRIFGEVFQTILQSFVSEDSIWMTNWHNFIYILLGGLIMFFFIFIKNISALKKVAYLGVISSLVLTVMMVILLLYESIANELDSDISWKYLFPNCTFVEAFHATPTIFVAFLFQFNAFPIYYSLRNRGMRSMMRATKIGVVYSLVLFLLVGVVGFLLYGFEIDDTILDNFSDDMIYYKGYNIFPVILIIIICIAFIITCFTSFPVLFLSLRVNYVNALQVCKRKDNQSDPRVEIVQGQYERKHTMVSEKVLIFITIILYLFIVTIAIVVPNLKPVFVAVGSIAGTFIGFILPSLFFILIAKKSGKKESMIVPFAFLGFGVFFLVICILMAFF